MSSEVDLAKDLLQFAAGPSILGVGALVTFSTSTFNDDRRISSKGWLAVGAGALLLGWLLLFLGLAADPVTKSLTADGPVEPVLVLLGAACLVSIGLALLVLWNVPNSLRYLVNCYRPEDTPWPLRPFHKMRK